VLNGYLDGHEKIMPLNYEGSELSSMRFTVESGNRIDQIQEDKNDEIRSYPNHLPSNLCMDLDAFGMRGVFLAFDMRFFQILKGWEPQARENIGFFILFAGIGGIFFVTSLKTLIRPKVILRADGSGITIFATQTSDEWNENTKKLDRVLKSGEAIQIPGKMVERIEAGTLHIQERSRIQADQKSRAWNFKSLRFLCDQSVNLDGFTREGIIHTRTGVRPEDMEASERNAFTEQEFEDYQKSKIHVPERMFRGNADAMVKQLEQLRN
jgi:hypothetical protein